MGFLLNPFVSLINTSSTNKANYNMQQQSLRQQREENQKDRDFNAEQAELAHNRQVDFYQQFQSPQALVRQSREAGMNPSAAFSSGGLNANGQMTQGYPASASSSSLPGPAQMRGVFDQLPDLLSSIGQFEKDMADAGYTRDTKPYILDKLDKEISGISLQNSAQEFENMIQQKFGLQKAWHEMVGLKIKNLLMEAQGRNYDADSELKAEQRVLTMIQQDLSGSELIKATFEISKLEENWQLFKKSTLSDISLNWSQVRKNNADAQTTDAVRQFVVDFEKYKSYHKKSEWSEHQRGRRDRLKILSEQAKQAGVLTDIQKQELEKAQRDNDWATVEKILDNVQKGVDIISSGRKAFKKKYKAIWDRD